jgi:AcrR family transcriptional regulator
MNKKPTRQSVLSEQKRELIYQTALKLIRKCGYTNTTLQDISDESGLSIGSVYHYFGNKAGIMRALFVEPMEASCEKLSVNALHLQDPCGTIMAAFCSLAHFYSKNIGIDIMQHARVLREEDALRTEDNRLLSQFQTELISFIKAAGLHTYAAVSLSDEALSSYFLAIFFGCVVNWAWNSMNLGKSLEETVEHQFSMALDIFRLPPQPKHEALV